MKKTSIFYLAIGGLVFSQWIFAAGNPTAAETKAQAVENKDWSSKMIELALGKVAPSFKPTSIKPSKFSGFYEVTDGSKTFFMTGDGKYLFEGEMTDLQNSKRPTSIPGVFEFVSGSKLFYVSEDGGFFMQGSLIDVAANKDLTEARLGEARIAELDRLGEKNMLIFKPQKTKHVVYVFTDIDCGYCRKLHSEIDQYLAAGIEVRYLFFPRAGYGSDSYNKAVSVWCSKDRQTALTKAKKGEAIGNLQCENPIKTHMKLGESFGASGTPMIVTDKGTIIPGYVNASSLAIGLDKESAK